MDSALIMQGVKEYLKVVEGIAISIKIKYRRLLHSISQNVHSKNERRDIMSNKELLLKKIEEVRELMNRLIEEKDELIDPEIVEVSQKLDRLLNEYNDLLNKDKKE